MAQAKITYEAPGADTVSGTLDQSKKIIFTGTPQKGQATFNVAAGAHVVDFLIEGTPGTSYKIELGGTGITPAPGQSPSTGTIANNRRAATFIEFTAKAVGIAAAASAAKRSAKKRPAKKPSTKKRPAKKRAAKKTSRKTTSRKATKSSAKKSRKSSKSRKGGRR